MIFFLYVVGDIAFVRWAVHIKMWTCAHIFIQSTNILSDYALMYISHLKKNQIVEIILKYVRILRIIFWIVKLFIYERLRNIFINYVYLCKMYTQAERAGGQNMPHMKYLTFMGITEV